MMYIGIYSAYIVFMVTLFYFLGKMVYQNPEQKQALDEIHDFLVETREITHQKQI